MRQRIKPKPSPSSPRPYRSRRRPVLRVVGGDQLPPRHAAVIQVTGIDKVAEVHTFAEMDALPIHLRPRTADCHIVPGIGWLTVRNAITEHEKSDIRDVAAQAWEAWNAEKGG